MDEINPYEMPRMMSGPSPDGTPPMRPVFGFLVALVLGGCIGPLGGGLASGGIGLFVGHVASLGHEISEIAYAGTLFGAILGMMLGLFLGPGLFFFALRKSPPRRVARIGAVLCGVIGGCLGLAAVLLVVFVALDGDWRVSWVVSSVMIGALTGTGAGWLLGAGIERALGPRAESP